MAHLSSSHRMLFSNLCMIAMSLSKLMIIPHLAYVLTWSFVTLAWLIINWYYHSANVGWLDTNSLLSHATGYWYYFELQDINLAKWLWNLLWKDYVLYVVTHWWHVMHLTNKVEKKDLDWDEWKGLVVSWTCDWEIWIMITSRILAVSPWSIKDLTLCTIELSHNCTTTCLMGWA